MRPPHRSKARVLSEAEKAEQVRSLTVRRRCKDENPIQNRARQQGVFKLSALFKLRSLLPANRRQKPAVWAGVLFQYFQPAMVAQKPAERFRRVRVLEVQPDALAAFERNLHAPYRRRQVAPRAER